MTLLHNLTRRLKRFGSDRSGVVGPVVAVLSVLLVAAAGLSLDVGLYYVNTRQLRAATEAAALAAAMIPGDATNRAMTYLVKNGYDASVIKSVEVGYYCANRDYAAASRFVSASNLSDCPGSSVQNAVRLKTGKKSQRFLSAVLGGSSLIPDLAATASAARIDEAGIAVTSDTLRLTSGSITDTLLKSVNGLLGGLIGVTLDLTGPEVTALMNHNIDAGKFFDALAKQTNQTGTYNELMQGTYTLKQVAAAASSASTDTATAAALTRLSGFGGDYPVPMSGLFGLGTWKNSPVGESDEQTGLRAGLNAYQLIAFAVQQGAGVLNLSRAVSLVVPGSTVKVSGLVTGASDRPRFSFGPAGETKVSTSKARLQLQLGLGDISVAGSLVSINSVPLLIDVDPAKAELTQLNCAGTDDQANNTSANVYAETGLIYAYIGNISNSSTLMTKQMPAVGTVTPATLFSVNLLGIVSTSATAKVVVGPVLGTAGTLTFGPNGSGTIGSPTTPGKSVSIRSSSQLATTINNVISGLTNGITVNLTLLKICLLGCDTDSTVKNTLISNLSTPLNGLVNTTVGGVVDPVLDTLLAALGIEIGNATVWVTGARCGVPVLI